MPGICFIMLSNGLPLDTEENPGLGLVQAAFFIGLGFQVLMFQFFYLRWMGVQEQQLGTSSTPYLLTIINWFLLTVLACKAKILLLTGLDFAPMLFGVGCFFAAVIYANIFARRHADSP